MKLLAIDTATEGCSATLLDNDVFIERFEVQPRMHADLILPMLDEILAEAGIKPAQLDVLAFGCGPGAFTGVRIATGVIQGIAYAADLPVVPVSTLQALAQRAYAEQGKQRVLSAFDARMNEVYWGAYELDEKGLMQLLGEELVVSPDAVPHPDNDGWAGAGSGWQAYGDLLKQKLAGRLSSVDAALITRSREIAVLAQSGFEQGKAVSAEQALPVYLRNRVAWKKQA